MWAKNILQTEPFGNTLQRFFSKSILSFFDQNRCVFKFICTTVERKYFKRRFQISPFSITFRVSFSTEGGVYLTLSKWHFSTGTKETFKRVKTSLIQIMDHLWVGTDFCYLSCLHLFGAFTVRLALPWPPNKLFYKCHIAIFYVFTVFC